MTNLTLEDILLLWYADNRAVGFPIPQYWQYDYQVDDIPLRLKYYQQIGLLDITTVRKKEKYIATDIGKELLSQYSHIFYYHSYRNTLDPRLNLYSVDSLYKETTHTSVEEFFIDYHTTAMYDYWNTQKYGAARNALLSIAEIYFRLPKYEQALANFLSISYLDMTGLDNCTAYRTSIDEIDIDLLQFAPGIISYIVICLRNLDATVQDLPKAFNLAVTNIDVPSSVYSKQEVLDMLTEAIVAAWET